MEIKMRVFIIVSLLVGNVSVFGSQLKAEIEEPIDISIKVRVTLSESNWLSPKKRERPLELTLKICTAREFLSEADIVSALGHEVSAIDGRVCSLYLGNVPFGDNRCFQDVEKEIVQIDVASVVN